MKIIKRKLAVTLALSAGLALCPVREVRAETPQWPSPGAIQLSKEATALEGEDNLWEVALKVEGKNHQMTSDVVLVIDTSGSMEGERLEHTKAAANEFASRLLEENGKTRIAIVSYNTEAFTNGVFYDYSQLASFYKEISGLRAGGGTNQQEGIHMADGLLYSQGSVGVIKNMVILSDGNATFSFPFSGTAQYEGCTLAASQRAHNYFDWGGDIVDPLFSTPPDIDYTQRIGNGRDFEIGSNARVEVTCETHGYTRWMDCGKFDFDGSGALVYSADSGTDHGVATLWEAALTKARGTHMFSIALQAGEDGTRVLNGCASSGQSYVIAHGETDVGGKLSSIFGDIAGKISMAATEGLVTDPMGEKVRLNFDGESPVVTMETEKYTDRNADVYISQGSIVYDQETETFFWEAGNIEEGTDALLKYRIRIREDVIVFEGEQIDTNKTTTFTYCNYKGEESEGEFPIPWITCPVTQMCTLEIKKYGWDEKDDRQSFLFLVEGTDEETASVKKEVVIHENGSAIITNLPDGNYRITEIESWSWRYRAEQPVQEIYVTRKDANLLEFHNLRVNPYWLDGNDFQVNRFIDIR